MAGKPIGFVGLGNMGAPMVRCLAKAGYAVVGYDVRDGVAAELAGEFGAAGPVRAAAALGDVGRDADIAITMLPDSAIVRRAVLGAPQAPGLVAAMRCGSVIVDMSSSFAPDTRALAAELAGRGIAVVDAPVSGGVGKAVSGTLAIMAGGDRVVVDRVAPVLGAMGQVHRTGGLGSGHAIKALNNYVSAAGLVATCEALAVAEAFGIDPRTAIDVINVSTGRNNTTENKAARYLIPRTYNSGFSLALMRKDVGMAQRLSRELGLELEELEFVASYLERAGARLGAEADHTAVMEVAAAGATNG